jgi:hypothetical protein
MTRELIRRLTAGTRAGSVPWEAENDIDFFVRTAAGLANVWSTNRGEHPYHFRFLTPNDMMLAEAHTKVGEYYASWEREIADLFQAAREKALGIKDTFEQFVEELRLPPAPPAADDDVPF